MRIRILDAHLSLLFERVYLLVVDLGTCVTNNVMAVYSTQYFREEEPKFLSLSKDLLS